MRTRSNPLPPNPDLKTELQKILPRHHGFYDPVEKLHRAPFSSPGYHTTLKEGQVHRTRESLFYAVALLDSGEEAWLERASGILEKVVSLQDTHPDNPTYGIWSWFYEEPLSQMAPPDWNWADFCGVQLLQADEHRSRLPPTLVKKIESALGHAAFAIRKRDVGPGYTNIALMGGYLTLVAGERYGWKEFTSYGRERLLKFAAYTAEKGGFTEFNSPTYTMVAIAEIGRTLAHVRDPEVLEKMLPVYRRAWEEVAHHFHAPSRQWAGAQSRAYRNLVDPESLAFISRSIGGFDRPWDPASGEAAHLSLEFARLHLPCPEDLKSFFRRPGRPGWKTQVVETPGGGLPPVTTGFYSTDAFSLGTVSRRIFWNQSRVLCAHWSGKNAPAYLQLRFLHDHYDFCSAHFVSAQEKERVCALVTFSRSGGDTHPNLDLIRNGSFPARDLRLSLEVGGEVEDFTGAAPTYGDVPVLIPLGEWQISLPEIKLLGSMFQPRWDFRKNPDPSRPEAKWSLDLVLYHGDEISVDTESLSQNALAFYFQFGKKDFPMTFTHSPIKTENGKIRLVWDDLKLEGTLETSQEALKAAAPKVK